MAKVKVCGKITAMTLTARITRNTAYLVVGKIGSTVLGVTAVAALLRYLSPDDYGRYTTAFAFIMLFGTFSDFGLNLTTTQDISLPGANVDRTLSNVFTMRLAINIGLIVLLPLILLLFPYESLVKEAVMLASVLFFASSLFQVLSSYFQKALAAGFVALAELAGKFAMLALILVAIWLKLSLLAVVAGMSLAAVCQFAALWLFIRQQVKLRLCFDFPVWRRIMSKTWPLAVSTAFATVYFKGDTIIMSLTRPYDEVGIYGAAYKILEVLIALPALFMGLVLPHLTASFAKNDRRRFAGFLQHGWDILAALTLPLAAGALVLAESLIAAVGGGAYEPATNVLRILIFAVGAIFLGSLFTHAVIAVGKQWTMIKYYIGMAVLATALYLALIPLYSYYAAAAITVFSEVIIALVAAWQIHRLAPINFSFTVFNKSLAASLLMAGLLYVLSGWPVVLLIVLGAGFYFLLLYIMGVFPGEFTKKIA